MIDDNKLKKALPLLFKNVKVPTDAKEQLKKQLFSRQVLSDDELSFVAAAGTPEPPSKPPNKTEQEDKQ